MQKCLFVFFNMMCILFCFKKYLIQLYSCNVFTRVHI